MNFSCDVCDKIFNGERPYTDHINSEKHKKKTQPNVPVAAKISAPAITRKVDQPPSDQTIVKIDNMFKCIKCNIILNSIQQAESHVVGKTHLKHVRHPLSYNGVTPVSSDPGRVLPVTENKTASTDTFTFHDITIENMTENIKVFDIGDPVYF